MKRLFVMVAVIAFLALSRMLVFAAETPPAADERTAQNAEVRIVHASPDAPAVDIFVDDKALVEGAKFKDASNSLPLSAGSHKVEVYEAKTKGTKDSIIEATLVVDGGKSYTVAAVNKAENLELQAFTNNKQGMDGKASLRVAHLSPDAPAVNVGPKGAAPLFKDLSFKSISGYQVVNPGSYDLSVSTADGKEILSLPGTNLQSGKNYTVLAVNTADKLETIVLQDN
ncbi:peptidase [Bacillus sp. Root239]|nr:peptidase [Bacillus sp. Root239]